MYPRDMISNGQPLNSANQNVHQFPRYLELLDALRKEFEVVAYDSSNSTNNLRAYKDEFEQKVQNQFNECAFLQKTILDLERAYFKMKQQYEDEISRLKKELESGIREGDATASDSPTGRNAAIASIVPSFLLNPSTNGVTTIGKAARLTLPEIDGAALGNKRLKTDCSAEAAGAFALPGAGIQESATHNLLSDRTASVDSAAVPRDLLSTSPDLQGVDPALLAASNKDPSSWSIYYHPKIARAIEVDLYSFFSHPTVVCCVRFSPNNLLVATGCNKLIQIFELASGSLYAALSIAADADKDVYVRSLAFSPDSKLLVSGSEDSLIRLWNVETKALEKTFVGHEQDVYAVEFMPNGVNIVSGSGDRTLRIWDVASAACDAVLLCGDGNDDAKENGITSISVSQDGRLIAVGSLDRLVRLWDFETRTLIASLEGHSDSIYSICFSSKARYLASGSLDKSILVWERDESNPNIYTLKHTISRHKDFVLSVAFTPDERFIISGSKDKTIHFWETESCNNPVILYGHNDSVISVCVSDDGLFFASGSGDHIVRVWSLKKIALNIADDAVSDSDADAHSTHSSLQSSDDQAFSDDGEHRSLRGKMVPAHAANSDEDAQDELEIFSDTENNNNNLEDDEDQK